MSMTVTPARRFQATETTTYRDLQATLRKIGATSLRVGSRDMLNPKDVRAEVVFDRGGVRYVVRCAKWTVWLDNLRAVQRTVWLLYQALEEYGATTEKGAFDQTFRTLFLAFEATPDDTLLMLPGGQRSWRELLGVPPTASRGDVINAFRALARVHHPDAGGDAETFKRLRQAYEQGLAEVMP